MAVPPLPLCISCSPFHSYPPLDLDICHLSNDHSDMIIHVLIDIPQKARCNDTHSSCRNTRQVHILIALRVCNLSGSHDDLICRVVASDPRNRLELLDEGGASEDDSFFDEAGVSYANGNHSSADVFDCVGDEFADKDVVVCAITDRAAYNADGEGQSRDGGNEVVRANDRCYDLGTVSYCSASGVLQLTEAGTTIPPVPSPPRISKPQSVSILSLVAHAKEAEPDLLAATGVSIGRKQTCSHQY